METTFIDYEVEGRIATITLNRAEAANAQTLPMLDDLDEAWRRAADDDEVRVIILQGNGKHFSAGHDIKGVSSDGDEPPTWTLAGIYATESAALPRVLAALAQHSEALDRGRAGCVHRRRTAAGLAL